MLLLHLFTYIYTYIKIALGYLTSPLKLYPSVAYLFLGGFSHIIEGNHEINNNQADIDTFDGQVKQARFSKIIYFFFLMGEHYFVSSGDLNIKPNLQSSHLSSL